MANHNNNASQHHDASPNFTKPYHVPHNWLQYGAENDANAQYASMVMDVSRGAQVIASILCNHLTDMDAIAGGAVNTSTLLSSNNMEALARLMLYSLGHLSEVSSARVDIFNESAEAGVRQ
jgi:hypothetical protein